MIRKYCIHLCISPFRISILVSQKKTYIFMKLDISHYPAWSVAFCTYYSVFELQYVI